MGVLVRLPNIWWTCACDVADSLGNEWTEYCEVLASTKDEAYDMAEDVCKRRGLGMFSAQIMARPEKKVEPGKEKPATVAEAVKALPAPTRPHDPVPPWNRTATPAAAEPEFEKAYFTKYTNHPTVVQMVEGT